MRTSIVKVVFALLSVFSVTSYGAGLANFEATCVDLGFKKKTAAYGECVLELDRRATADQKQAERQRAEQQRLAQDQEQREQAQRLASQGDGTPDHQTCFKFGFIPNTPAYAECRLKISIAKREAEQRQAAFDADQRRYEAEKLAYDEKVAAAKKAEERARRNQLADFLMLSGAAGLAGTSPYGSVNMANGARVAMGLPPIPPSQPEIQNFTITSPSGRMTRCRAFGNNINCF